MFNWAKTWVRVRQLEAELAQLADEVSMLSDRFKRWDARQRQRQQRGGPLANSNDCKDCEPGPTATAVAPSLPALLPNDSTRSPELRSALRERFNQRFGK